LELLHGDCLDQALDLIETEYPSALLGSPASVAAGSHAYEASFVPWTTSEGGDQFRFKAYLAALEMENERTEASFVPSASVAADIQVYEGCPDLIETAGQ
jgi:hypothetical protein